MNDTDANSRTVSTAEFNETPKLVLEQPVGDVTIQGWDKPEIQITSSGGDDFDVEVNGSQVIIHSRQRNVRLNDVLEPAVRELNNMGLDMERVASKLERSVARSMRHVSRGWNVNIELGRWSGNRDYVIQVPHSCDLSLRTSSGDVYIKDVNGTHFLQSTSGDINFQRGTGTVLAHTASGDLELQDVHGKVAVHTASGDINLRRCDLQELSVHSASGDLTLALDQVPQGDFEIRTVSGDLRVSLPWEARLTAEVSTLSGDIRCKFPNEITRRSSSRNQTLVVNGGGMPARFSTVSGDITVEPRRDMPRPASTENSETNSNTGAGTVDLSRAQTEHAESDRTEPEGFATRRRQELEILQALERGEITSQDAMQRLSGLGR